MSNEETHPNHDPHAPLSKKERADLEGRTKTLVGHLDGSIPCQWTDKQRAAAELQTIVLNLLSHLCDAPGWEEWEDEETMDTPSDGDGQPSNEEEQDDPALD